MRSILFCKYSFSLFVCLIFLIGCGDIPWDNVLDPQNPNSYQESTILLEAFVNTANPYEYNRWALQALDSIQQQYRADIIIAEYHRDTQQYADLPYSNSIFELLYDKYVAHSNPAIKGVPDIFINGISHRVQGASGISSVISRLNSILSEMVIVNSHFTLEPGDIHVSETEITATCKIARLGNQSAEDLLLRLIAVHAYDSGELKRVVTNLVKSDIISRLNAGEIKTVVFDAVPISVRPSALIFSLTSADELTVYQNIRVVL
jgi:hypothetical protein